MISFYEQSRLFGPCRLSEFTQAGRHFITHLIFHKAFFMLVVLFCFGSIAVGLEVIEEGTPLDSDSDVGHYMVNDMSDSRKCILQIQQLNRRVRELEGNVDRNSVGFWSKIALFAFTIINPIILHWLFWKRR